MITVQETKAGWYFFKAHQSSFSTEPMNVEIIIILKQLELRLRDGIDNDEDGFFDLMILMFQRPRSR